MYFKPYIDGTGVHIPTYEDRIEELEENYSSIFGEGAALTAASPDYQLLSLFARALDDMSHFIVLDYVARNPDYAVASQLDILMAIFGLSRQNGETDASCRARLRQAASAKVACSCEGIAGAVLTNSPTCKACRVYENDTDETDENGIPAHSICVVTYSGKASLIAKAIFDNKAPGIGTYGGKSVTVTDSFGSTHTIKYQLCTLTAVVLDIQIRAGEGFDETETPARIKEAIVDWASGLGIGESVEVNSLYPVIFSADTSFSVVSLTATPTGGSATTGTLEATWKQRFNFNASYINITVVE